MEMAFYRSYLREELTRRCQRNSRYSLRAFARALTLDPAALSRILSGKLLPSASMSRRMLSSLELSHDDQRRFLASLSEVKISYTSRRLAAFFRESTVSGAPAQQIGADVFRVISDWYHYALLELTETPRFRSSAAWIAAELGIGRAEASLALERLRSLGLLAKRKGRWVKVHRELLTGDRDLTTPALRRRQKQILEKALFSLENDPLDARDHTAMTMAIDPRKIPEAKRRILNFSRELCTFLESGERSQVYELSVALFPLQKKASLSS